MEHFIVVKVKHLFAAAHDVWKIHIFRPSDHTLVQNTILDCTVEAMHVEVVKQKEGHRIEGIYLTSLSDTSFLPRVEYA